MPICTEYLDPVEVDRAASLLLAGELIAFPTETVYGLGANALSELSVDRIFEAKGRPSDNPLIVHIARRNQVEHVARTVPDQASRLMDAFWPGPLTLVLPKQSSIPDNVTAGLDTVGVRIPSDQTARSILEAVAIPVAAPSANRSGRPSATTEDLDGRIAGIVRGASTTLGLESTVVDVSREIPRLLRPGAVTLEQLRSVLPNLITLAQNTASKLAQDESLNSPGLRHRHYQPTAKVKLVYGQQPISSETRQKAWYIGLDPPFQSSPYERVWSFPNVQDYAARLFELFRMADHEQIERIDCQAVAEEGLGVALMDRLRRASE
jgi:L-threonylcarbamoyladenylate synthase